MQFRFLIFCLILIYNCSCTSTYKNFNPQKKFGVNQLQQDFTLARNVLEKIHPTLYWYLPKDSMDMYFNAGYKYLKDSMTEQEFNWKIMAPIVHQIHCGHTSIRLSEGYEKWAKNKVFASFPLYLKCWNDTMAVVANLDSTDRIFKRGTIIKSINKIPANKIVSKMLLYLSEDGYAHNVSYIRISNNFPALHRNIFGLSKTYAVEYLDSLGTKKSTILKLFEPKPDSTIASKPKNKVEKDSNKIKRNEKYRSLKIDSSGKFAVMQLNTFSNGGLNFFFRKSFRLLKRKNMNNLIIDLRNNGGGYIFNSNLLIKYISRTPVLVADSIYAKVKSLKPYTHNFKMGTITSWGLRFMTNRKQNGHFKENQFQNQLLVPKIKNHYNGKVYVLISGPTFSASTLFANAVKGQSGIKLLGEETGGGWYGNGGVLIQDVVLPNTKLRLRMPLFKVVQYNHKTTNFGLGIPPDIYVPTSYDALIKGYDKKMQVAKSLIMQSLEK
jgi:hypothetical protein